MTASCSCSPGACHGGHTIDFGMPRLTDARVNEMAADLDDIGRGVPEMAAELLALRAYATDHEGRCNTLCPRCSEEVLGDLLADARARITELEDANARVQEFYERARRERDEARARVAELEAEARGCKQLTVEAHSRFEDVLLQRDQACARVAELEAGSPKITSETSDGYHTFTELYHYRMLYNAALFNEWAAQGLYDVHKSVRHSDGEVCFDGKWFVVYAQLPTGQISNHYEISDWYKFRVPIRNEGAEWDGHTPQQAADRLAALLEADHRPAVEPIGYGVVYVSESGRYLSADPVLTLGHARIKADRSRRASFDSRVVELREVTEP